jgi:deoxyribonuclease-4
VLHPGAHTGSGEEAGIARIAEALNRIHDETPACADTVTCLELMAGQGSTIGRSLGQLRLIIDAVADPTRVGVCIDTCHAFAAGYDLRTAPDYEQFMLAIDNELGRSQVKVWHLNDSKGKFASNVDRHEHIGQGEIGDEGFRPLLNDLRWAGVAMLVADRERVPPALRSGA